MDTPVQLRHALPKNALTIALGAKMVKQTEMPVATTA